MHAVLEVKPGRCNINSGQSDEKGEAGKRTAGEQRRIIANLRRDANTEMEFRRIISGTRRPGIW